MPPHGQDSHSQKGGGIKPHKMTLNAIADAPLFIDIFSKRSQKRNAGANLVTNNLRLHDPDVNHVYIEQLRRIGEGLATDAIKIEADRVTVQLKTGKTDYIPIHGGTELTRDVYAVLTFMQLVVADMKKDG